MKRFALMAANGLLAVFGLGVVAVQLFAYHVSATGTMDSIKASYLKGILLAHTTNIVSRGGGTARLLDLTLPPDARLYLAGVAGTNHATELAQYYYLSYHLFPRELAVTLDAPRFTADGFQGRTTASDAEIRAHGYNVRLDLLPDGRINLESWVGEERQPTNPGWFDSWSDTFLACALPPCAAGSGVWLMALVFGRRRVNTLSLGETLAGGLGFGMMALAALTLGVKLCGLHGRGWIATLAAAGAVYELYGERRFYWRAAGGVWRTLAARPLAALLWPAGAAVFLILFRLAGLQDIQEFDGAANWVFKAKILFFATGHSLVGYFSNPRLAYAHLDYPMLVPALHAATFDALGHVDELVTKFWPAWMLLFLLAALAGLNPGAKTRFPAPLFFLLGALLLPFIQIYVQMEGGTMPMIFFATLGLVQCALGWARQDRFRLGLGLMFLFGGALTKFEGAIFLALAVAGIFLTPSARPLLRPPREAWRLAAFGFMAALPFLCLRAQIPVLHYESGWVHYALAEPAVVLANFPKILEVLLGRVFLAPTTAHWNVANGQLHWIGKWDGFWSLCDHFTIGLPWLSLFLTVLLWLAAPSRRPIILWMLSIFFGAIVILSVVFASFVSESGLAAVITQRASDNEAGRYLFPLVLAWAAVMVALLYDDTAGGPSTGAATALETGVSPHWLTATNPASATSPPWPGPSRVPPAAS